MIIFKLLTNFIFEFLVYIGDLQVVGLPFGTVSDLFKTPFGIIFYITKNVIIYILCLYMIPITMSYV